MAKKTKNTSARRNTKRGKEKDINNSCKETAGRNDISWYTKHAELVGSAAKIPFVNVPGGTLTAGPAFPNINTVRDFEYTIPGIMRLNFYPTIGVARDVNDPVNVAAREVYAKIRSKYSGSLEADSPDIMMYILALDSLYMMYEDVKRAYYLSTNYSAYNRMFPQEVVNVCGYDMEEIQENKSLVYTKLVEFAAQLSKFPVPDTFPIFKRHSFMTSNIYADSTSPKSQLYVFVPKGYYQLENTTEMTELKMVPAHRTSSILNVLSDMFDSLNVLTLWDTSYTILGYMLRAYEDTSFLTPSPVVQDAILSPVYNELVLLQIRNATIIGPTITSVFDVKQDPTHDNILISKPYFKGQGAMFRAGMRDDCIINLPMDNPTPADIIETTRLSVTRSLDQTGAPEDAIYIDCGTEVITDAVIFTSNGDTGVSHTYGQQELKTNVRIVGHLDLGTDNPEEDMSYMMSDLADFIISMSYLSAFNYHPIIPYQIEFIGMDPTVAAPSGVMVKQGIFSDVQNITTIDRTTLSNLHRYCAYSEYNCF